MRAKRLDEVVLKLSKRELGAVEDSIPGTLRVLVPPMQQEAVTDDTELKVFDAKLEMIGYFIPTSLNESLGIKRRFGSTEHHVRFGVNIADLR